MPQGRYRADLIDVGWAPEHTYGTPPAAAAELGADDEGTANKALYRQWGIVNGGINLPNPTFAWTPFYGIGVDDRNMLFPIQGQETLEGGIPSVMLCHDSSRLAFEQMYGLAFNAFNTAGSANITPSAGWTTATATVTATSVTFASSAPNFTTIGPSSSTVKADPPTHIILIGDAGDAHPNPWTCTWAYIGAGGADAAVNVFQDRDLSIAGWNGKRPSGGASTAYAVCSVARVSGGSVAETGVLATTGSSAKTVYCRPTLVQQSFMLGAKFRADDGSNFITNYTGCKVSRFTMSMDEGNPVTFNYDFIAQDMRHNIGEDDGTGAATDVARYMAKGVTAASNTYDIQPMRVSRVTEQPYFFTGAQIKMHGTTFARVRSLSISVDNALDPRYYVTQSAATSSTTHDRQILYEILEGRRTITVSGSVDMDNTGSATAGGTAGRPTDAKLLQYVLNQGFMDADQRDMQTLKGMSLEIELRKINSGAAAASAGHDKIMLTLPDPGKITQSGAEGSAAGVGLYLNSAGHSIPAPPSINIPVDFDGQASSMSIEFLDNAPS